MHHAHAAGSGDALPLGAEPAALLAEPITFFWQSKLPPEGPAEAFSLRADEKIAMASGPFPPKKDEDSAEKP